MRDPGRLSGLARPVGKQALKVMRDFLPEVPLDQIIFSKSARTLESSGLSRPDCKPFEAIETALRCQQGGIIPRY